MRGIPNELAPARKSPRCHVNTPLADLLGNRILRQRVQNVMVCNNNNNNNNDNNNNNLILILRAFYEMIKRALHDFYLLQFNTEYLTNNYLKYTMIKL